MSGPIKEYIKHYTLTAPECSPQAIMPLTLLAGRVIETATYHANDLGIGYARLLADGKAWVLSRLSIEMRRWPSVSEEYTLRTWIEGFNRHFSERNFEITGLDDEVLGHARSIWMAIDIKERQGGDLSMLDALRDTVCDRPCPMEKTRRFSPVGDTADYESRYRFRYCDCDFNRHVNTLRYIELIQNRWDMDFYDSHRVSRFDIAFMHEAKCAQEAMLLIRDDGDDNYSAEITPHGEAVSRARMAFTDYEYKQL